MSMKVDAVEMNGGNASNVKCEMECAAHTRRPYKSPVLDCLGDVRDVTLAGSGTGAEAGQSGTTYLQRIDRKVARRQDACWACPAAGRNWALNELERGRPSSCALVRIPGHPCYERPQFRKHREALRVRQPVALDSTCECGAKCQMSPELTRWE